MSTRKETQEPIKLYHPDSCPPPFDATRMIIMRKTLCFGDKNFIWGTHFIPVAGGILKIISIDSDAVEDYYGYWDARLRRSVLCNQDHPGLFPYFLFTHRYVRGNRYHIGEHRLGQQDDHPYETACHVVDVCFPQSGEPSPLQKDLGYTFLGFLELMTIANKIGELERDALITALNEKKNVRLKEWHDAMTKQRRRVMTQEHKDHPNTKDFNLVLENDSEVTRLRQCIQAINDEFAPAETALNHIGLSPAPYAPQE